PLTAQEPVGDFTVALGAERLAARLEIPAQPAEVVDLAVVDERGLPVRRDRGLFSQDRRIQDREAPGPEDDGPVRVDPGPAAVGPAAVQGLEGAVHRRRVDPSRIDPPGDAAHSGTRAGKRKSETGNRGRSARPSISDFRFPIHDYEGNGYISQAT